MMKNIVFCILSLLLLFTGCEGGKVGLKGKIVFSDDGSPLPIGTVCFESDNYLSRGHLKPDGTFAVGSLKQTDGFPSGTYRVYVTGATKVVGQDQEGNDLYEPLINEKFFSGKTSGLTIDVTPSTQYFEVVVDRYQPKKKK